MAIAAAPDGTIYITDWVLKDYPNHGRGRIWKLATRAGVAVTNPVSPAAGSAPEAGAQRLERLLPAGAAEWPEVRAAWKDEDPFVRHAATVAAAQPELRAAVERELAEGTDAALRLGALLALRRTDVDNADELLRRALADPDETVRMMAMIWAGEKELRPLLPLVDAAIDLPGATTAFSKPGSPRCKSCRAQPDPRARRLSAGDTAQHRALLLELARHGDASLRLEALRSLVANTADEAVAKTLRSIAADRNETPRVRAEAIAALGAGAADALAPFVEDPEAVVRRQVARTLRRENASTPGSLPPAPNDADGWSRHLATGGDAEAGERVFHSLASTCAQCHRIHGRGGTLGPDLSLIARTVSRERLIRSIVAPSEEVSPQFQGWEVKTKSGEVITGLQGHWRGGAATLVTLDGRERRIPAEQIVSFQAMPHSLMPEGLAALFSVEEFRDLVAYLHSLR